MKKFAISLFVGLLAAALVCVGGFIKTSERISGDVLRLHVLANSDSRKDQELKLKVRDAVLEEGKNIFGGEINVGNAREKISSEKDRLIKTARDVISQNGFDYDVDIFVKKEFFDTRSYGDLTLPAGTYTAVKVEIGEATGHNWWCIMFPPLCLPAAQEKTDVNLYLDKQEVKVVKSDPDYDVRFKVVEWYEKIREYFRKE
ncbi:MAG: stage II sporulation protein R [Clostridia bacterium]|nr:stage II sporulation protein R [Clostridia bacterium]